MARLNFLLALSLAIADSTNAALPACGATPKSGAASGFSKYATNAYKAPWDKSKTEAQNKAAGACQIAGYAVGSDVTPHASVDLDQKAFEAKIKTGDWTGAGKIYADGDKNSMKSSGARTLKGFSTSVEKKMIATKEATALDYKAYWGAADYADTFVQKALTATKLPIADSKVRAELLKKGTAYQHVWLYTLHELYDAIADCKGAQGIKDNDKGVHAWDEGWAFYAGSQQSVGQADGYMIYNLAQKRCGNFGTCASDGVANSNKKLLSMFSSGRDLLVDGKCAEAEALIPKIVSQMTVPLLQGTLRYAYKADLWKKDQREAKCAGSVPELAANKGKEIAEGWAFAAAVLPQLHKCDAAKAKMIRDNMDVMAAVPVKDTYSKVTHTLQSMYACLGVTCADIGGLESGTGQYYPRLEPCDDTQSPRSFAPPNDACPGTAGATTTAKEVSGAAGVTTTAGATTTAKEVSGAAGANTTAGVTTAAKEVSGAVTVASKFVVLHILIASIWIGFLTV